MYAVPIIAIWFRYTRKNWEKSLLILKFPIRNACLIEVVLASTLHTGLISADQLTNDAVTSKEKWLFFMERDAFISKQHISS